MTTKFPRLLLMGAMLTPTSLYALGLGEIHLNSALNQPFDAEIELISPTAEELQSLKVGLASADAFSRYGVDRPAFLSDFRFRVTRSDDGRSVLKVTSPETVTEPFVTFIVEAGWSRGRLLREYTVLLDPPVYMPPGAETAAPVATPRAGARSEGVIERPREAAPRPARTAAPAAPAQAPAAYPGGTYTVQRNDTLWRIASRIRPGSPRVVNQTMMAIYSANPQAFDGNINLLRSGAVLQIPDGAAMDQISAAEASRAVSAQYEAWRGGTDAGDSGRLRLVAPEEAAAPGARTAAPQPRATAASAEDPALRARVDQLESELSEARRLLELRNAELAEMQRRLSESGGEAPVEPTTPAEPAAQTPPPVIEEPVVEEPVATAPSEPEPAAEPAAEPQRPAATPPVVRQPEPTLLERIGDYWWALVVLGLAILAGLLLYFRKRRQPDIEDALETLTPQDFAARRPQAARGRSEAFEVEETASRDTIARPPARVAAAAAAAAGAAAAEETSADDTISEPGIAFDQQDALAEADFHMAYGLYDQAADLVKLAIQQEPDRRDLKLKLLEIYFVWGNKDMFLETARELDASRASAEPGEWDKVLIMGKQICPDEPLFEGAVSGDGGTRSVDLNLEGGENRVDVDLFAEPGESESPTGLDLEFNDQPSTAAARRIDDTGIDFLLDEPQRGGTDFDVGDDTMARTQETPTVENKAIESSRDETVELDGDADTGSRRSGVEQTAELAIDDLGIDVDSFADTDDHDFDADDERDAQAPHSLDATGTILLDEEALMSGSATAEQPQLDVSSSDVDFDLGNLEEEVARKLDSTAEWASGPLSGEISEDDFDEVNLADTRDGPALSATREMEAPSLGDELAGEDDDEFRLADTRSGQGLTATHTMEAPDLSELEPVTMSEVGTKLDLARAYVDMGDPDGARSILEEVLQEGSTSQKEEAQRLLESIV